MVDGGLWWSMVACGDQLIWLDGVTIVTALGVFSYNHFEPMLNDGRFSPMVRTADIPQPNRTCTGDGWNQQEHIEMMKANH